MAIDLQNPTNIGTGWGKPPDYSAPSIGSLVSGILENRYRNQKLQQENIADAIKQYQSQRESSAYTEALQKAGLLPEGDYGGLGMKGGESLADMIMRQKAEQALEAHRAGLLGVAQSRVGRGGGGGDVSEEPETYTDPQGRVWQKTRTGWKTLPVGLQPTDVRTQNENQILKEQAGLLESKGQMDAEIASQRQANITAGKANVPYTRSDEYNRTVNRLKQLQQSKALPGTQPDATPQPSPAETGDTLPTNDPQAQGTPRPSSYASPDQIRMARARQAMDDPQATAAEKEQARKILAGE